MGKVKSCELCGSESVGTWRFCVDCRKVVRRRLSESGYLQRTGRIGHVGQGRTYDQRENVYETKYGRD